MGRRRAAFLCAVVLLSCAVRVSQAAEDGYLVGIGKADITGPVADVNLMGYANPGQFAGGIHIRLFARTFIVADAADPAGRVAFVNLDAGMASQAVTFTVLERLRERYGELYGEQNVALSGTHTHAGPAGYLQYMVYDIASRGFYPQTFNAIVDGVVLSIQRAHDSLAPGSLSVGAGELLDANINRSPTAYLANPAEERALYQHDVDKQLTLLRLDGPDGSAIGAFSWFPVHGTSMNNTNTLVSGDNKGAAAQFVERWARAGGGQRRGRSQAAGSTDSTGGGGTNSSGGTGSGGGGGGDSGTLGSRAGSGAGVSPSLVAAFCQANVGDTSPNTLGAFCLDTGLPCDAVHSTCNGRVQQCIGRGPGWPDHFESTRLVGQRQADKALELLLSDLETIRGPIQYRHAFLDMRGIQVQASDFTQAGRTCKPAMGFAFAAGTTDGPGAFDFTQGDTNGTAFWRLVRNFIQKPTPEQEACHAPKPILLDVGEMHYPYEWVPYIVEIQILRIGQLVVLSVPGEFTTMAGRRLKRAVQAAVRGAWGEGLHLVIAGLSNTYASYITTPEEYAVQRYEGGFTLFGPHTLDAYIQEFVRLAGAMVRDEPTDPGPAPPNQLAAQWSLVPPVVWDGPPAGKRFGDMAEDVPRDSYRAGETVAATFHAGCPRNNIRAEGTFLAVERQAGDGSWQVVATDDDWATKFRWGRRHELSELSFATVEWTVPEGAPAGAYRLRHCGDAKPLFSSIVHSYEGVSRTFYVEGPPGSSSSGSGGNKQGSSEGGGVWAEVRQGLAALGRRAGAGSTWLLRSLHEQGRRGG
ncbi:hypothetical protein ABPG75_003823 [Micractinium tetrahymenae]